MTSPYESTPHVARTSPLRLNDRSRYGQIRLVVTRSRSGVGTVSLIVRSVGGGVLKDTRIAAGQVDLSPGSAASTDPLRALELALGELLERAGPRPSP